jgi:hypothetical protein
MSARRANGKMLYTKLKHRTKVLKELQNLGVVDPIWLRNIEIFEEFHDWPELCAICRYELLADKFGMKSSSSVKKIIERMSRD